MKKLVCALLAPLFISSLNAQELAAPAIGVAASSGNVAAATATATLPAIANRNTYLCGFMVSGLGATAGGIATLTISGLSTANITFDIGVPAGATVPIQPHVAQISPCLAPAAMSASIVGTMTSFGTGNTAASVTLWGYQSPR